MAVDLESLSNADLMALASGNLEGMSNDGLKVIASTAAKPKRSNMDELGRQAGLTARALVSGVAGIPLMAGDAVNSLLNYPIRGINSVAGKEVVSEFGSASQAAQQLMTKAGLPEPSNSRERIVQDVASGIAGTGGMVKLGAALPKSMAATKELLASNPGFQVAGGAAAPAAAGYARENDVGELGQLGAAILAGTVVPSGGASAAVLGNAAKRIPANLVKPFTQEGREVITGNILRSLANNPEKAIRNLDDVPSYVRGSLPTTAGASKDVGLASAENAIRSMDSTGQFANRASSNNAARQKVLDRLAGESTAEDMVVHAKNKRDAVTAPMREEAFDFGIGSVNTSPIVNQIDNILSGQTGSREYVEKAMKWLKSRLDGAGDDPRRLDGVRQDINDYIEGRIAGSQGENFKLAAKELTQVRNALTKQIDNVADGYSDYLAQYGKMSKPVEQMEKIRDIRKRTATGIEDMNTGLRSIAPVQFGKIVDDAKGDLAMVLSPAQLSHLRRVSKDIDMGMAANQTGVKQPGSDTFKNMSMANVIGQVIGKNMFGEKVPKIAMPLQWIYGGSDDAIRGLLVDAMLDPQMAKRMMMKANSMTVEPISNQLKKRAMKLGYGQAFGLNVQD